jgi:hypothetical protein
MAKVPVLSQDVCNSALNMLVPLSMRRALISHEYYSPLTTRLSIIKLQVYAPQGNYNIILHEANVTKVHEYLWSPGKENN